MTHSPQQIRTSFSTLAFPGLTSLLIAVSGCSTGTRAPAQAAGSHEPTRQKLRSLIQQKQLNPLLDTCQVEKAIRQAAQVAFDESGAPVAEAEQKFVAEFEKSARVAGLSVTAWSELGAKAHPDIDAGMDMLETDAQHPGAVQVAGTAAIEVELNDLLSVGAQGLCMGLASDLNTRLTDQLAQELAQPSWTGYAGATLNLKRSRSNDPVQINLLVNFLDPREAYVGVSLNLNNQRRKK